ncbi:MAG TPA: TadE/TadG family type IV pilus assembly protein [Candidatus Acidoferrum sp.]|jgi:hypothetical protein|nr:TadE/TadG family type IV pilus assembly protein [Candidatus Acidoferrum sp.]
MKRRTLQWKVLPDEGGQALTEFVIVIPIVLLFFFAMLQYFSIVQATQMGNYAAFVAARVYAVSESCDTNAQTEAQTAAAIVLAPIARPVPGEIGGDTSLGSAVNDLESTLGSFTGTKLGADIYDYASGYLMANYIRLNPNILGGSLTCGLTNFTSSSPTQVVVTLNYPQPIYVPGLAEMWNFITGSNIYQSLNPTAQGLSGIPKYLLPLYAGTLPGQNYLSDLSEYDSGAANSLQSFGSSLLSDLPTVLLPYVNIQSECAIGYSGWSGVPRTPDDTSDSSATDTNLDNSEQNIQNYNTANSNYTNAVNAAKTQCQDATNACGKINADNATISEISAIPPNKRTAAQNTELANAQSDLPTQESNLGTAESKLDQDNANVKKYADEVNQYQSELGSAVQNQGGDYSGSFQPMATSINCPACGY